MLREKILEMSRVILVAHSVDGFKYGIEFQSGCLKVKLKQTCISPPPVTVTISSLGLPKTHKYMDTKTNVDNSPVVLTYQV